MIFHSCAEVFLTVEKSLLEGLAAGLLTNIGKYGIVGSNSKDTASSVHTAPDSLLYSQTLALKHPNSIPLHSKMDTLEVRL